MDKRQASRFKVHLPIAFLGYNLTGEGIVGNLSMEGCAVESDQKVQRMHYYALSVSLPDQAVPMKVDLAAVRWSSGREFGLEFLRMEPEVQARLRGFVSTLDAGRGQ